MILKGGSTYFLSGYANDSFQVTQLQLKELPGITVPYNKLTKPFAMPFLTKITGDGNGVIEVAKFLDFFFLAQHYIKMQEDSR